MGKMEPVTQEKLDEFNLKQDIKALTDKFTVIMTKSAIEYARYLFMDDFDLEKKEVNDIIKAYFSGIMKGFELSFNYSLNGQ